MKTDKIFESKELKTDKSSASKQRLTIVEKSKRKSAPISGGVKENSMPEDADKPYRKSMRIKIQQRSLPLQKRTGKEDSDINEDDGVLSQRQAARRQFQKEDHPEIDNVRTLKKHSLSHKRKDPPAKGKAKKVLEKHQKVKENK